MKHKIFALEIIVLLVLCCTAYSQTPESTPKVNQKDKKEIEKFADEFMTDLKLTNDISQVSEKFFVADFKTRLAKNGSLNFVSDNQELKTQISDSDLYYSKVAFINFLNLETMLISKKYKAGSDEEEPDGKDFMKKYLPPHIVDLITRGKWFSLLENDENSYKDEKTTAEIFAG